MRTLFRIHSALGLISGLALVLVGLSGAALVFMTNGLNSSHASGPRSRDR